MALPPFHGTRVLSMKEKFKAFTAVKIELDAAATGMRTWLERYGPVSQVQIPGLDAALEYLTPIKSHPTRYVVISDHGWCYLQSDGELSFASTDGFALARRFDTRAIGVALRDEQREVHVYEGQTKAREIQSRLDGDRWYYREGGTLQSWEDPADGARSPKRNRLSVAQVAKYFQAYCGRPVPEWRTLVDNDVVGFERSSRGAVVEIRHYKTVNDLLEGHS